MALEIRFATVGDAALIAELSRQTFVDTFAPFNRKEDMDLFLEQQFTHEKLMEEVGAPGNIFLIATDESVMGYARLRENNRPPELETNNTLEIARLYAVSAAIGKGVGKALMQKSLAIAAELKKDTVWLGVWEKNERAIHFYKQWGFEPFATHVFQLGTDAQTDWLMKRNV